MKWALDTQLPASFGGLTSTHVAGAESPKCAGAKRCWRLGRPEGVWGLSAEGGERLGKRVEMADPRGEAVRAKAGVED